MLSRAKTLDGDTVEGMLVTPNPDIQEGIHTFEVTDMYPDTGHRDCYMQQHTIDPSTLEYKIGETWYSMEELLHIEGYNLEDTAPFADSYM
jgi:hypothetical protein